MNDQTGAIVDGPIRFHGGVWQCNCGQYLTIERRDDVWLIQHGLNPEHVQIVSDGDIQQKIADLETAGGWATALGAFYLLATDWAAQVHAWESGQPS